MTVKLIYHKNERGVSPFDKIIHEIADKSDISICCPYIGINYLEKILSNCKSWRIISDIKAWIDSQKGSKTFQKIEKFIKQHNRNIHHYENLHAKVIISKNKALIGSANLTKKGICERVEMSALLEDESHIDELNIWFDKLWRNSNKIENSELNNLINSVKDKIKNKQDYNLPNITSKAPQIKSKLLKKKSINNNSTKLFSEQEILDIVIAKNKIKEVENFKKAFQYIKDNIPYDTRDSITVRTNTRKNIISFLIRNHLISRFPSHSDDQSYKGEDLIRSACIIYPMDDIGNLKNIVFKELNPGRFKLFNCGNIRLDYKIILQFGDIHWKSFHKACFMEKDVQRTKSQNANIKIDWQ